MKFKINAELLHAPLKLAKTISSRKTQFNAKDFTKLEAKNDELIITVTDSASAFIHKIPAEVIEEGVACPKTEILSALVGKFPKGTSLAFSSVNENLTLKTNQATNKIAGMLAENYPNLELADRFPFQVSSLVFKEMLKRAAYLVSTDENFPQFAGVNIALKGNKLILTGTDQRRLSYLEYEAPEAFLVAFEKMLPRQAVVEVFSILDDEGAVEFGADENKIYFKCGNNYVAAVLSAAKFPDISGILISKEEKQNINLNALELKQAVERIGIVADSKAFAIKLAVAEDSLILAAENRNNDSGEETLEIIYKGEPFQIVLSGHYLSDFIANTDKGEIQLGFNALKTRFELREDESIGFSHICISTAIKET